MTSGIVFAEIVLAIVAVAIAVGAPLLGMSLQHRSESWESEPDALVSVAADDQVDRELVAV